MAKQNERRGWRPSGLAVVVLLLVACGAAAGFLLWTGGRGGPGGSRAGASFRPGDWLAAALTSRMFLSCALVTFASAGALAVLGGMLWRAGERYRARSRGQDGTGVLEFAMVLPIGLMLVLIMTQSSLLMVGNLCVNYAAYCAARSAVVSVPADLSPTEPPNVVSDDATASAKMRRVHLAAVWAVLPVSCQSRDIPEGDAQDLIDGLEGMYGAYSKQPPGWIRAYLGRKLRYAEDYTEVTLLPPSDGEAYKPHEDLKVTVRHTFYMAVPYAGRLLALMSGDGVELNFAQGEYGMVIQTACRLTNEGVQDWVEAEKFPRPLD